VPDQEYDIIDSNYNTIDVDRSQSSNNVVCMEGEYASVEPDGHLTTNINWGLEQ
jgi:N-acetylglutamate synthase/N-acetylornithine aminotransferase